MTAMTVVVRDLVKRFPARRSWRDLVRHPFHASWTTALDGVTLEVERGQVVGLLGPNGTGKTTLMKILCTLLLPTAGQVLVDGHDVVAESHAVRQTVGYCLDTERSFYYRLTGAQNLAFFAVLNNLTAREVATRVAQVLDLVSLSEAAHVPFMTYSKGMQQKLGLARALLTNPAILLLDEPTKGLDPGAASAFRRFLRDSVVGMGKTVLLVTHSLEEARECCDRVAIMDHGRVVSYGTWGETQQFIQTYGFPGAESV